MERDPSNDDSREELRAQGEKLKRREFTLDDFRKQMAMIAQPGLIQKMMGMMPGFGPMHDSLRDVDTDAVRSLLGIIDSLTAAERASTKLIDPSRRRRIAAGAGCEPHQVGELIKQYEAMACVMTAMADKGLRDRVDLLGEVQKKEQDWPFKPNRDDDEDPPPDDPLCPMLA